MKRFFRMLIALSFPAGAGAVLFLAAGRMDLPVFWAVLVTLALFLVFTSLFADPGLWEERIQPGPGARRDWHRALSFPIFFAHWILAGLDVGRFGWTAGALPLGGQVAALAGYSICLAVIAWAMVSNPFYSSVVRIQEDRGHVVVMTGPYRLVRHPGYAATTLAIPLGGFALGSLVSLVPLVLVIPLMIRRILSEDRLLLDGLAGYADYAGRVKYRLVPRVW